MKRILVFSDSHGHNENMMEVIRRYPDADMILHMGDIECGEKKLREAVSCPLHIVKGNCDWDADLPTFLDLHVFGKKILMTHGHRYVNYAGIDNLRYWALENGADIVMFGHTHVPFLEQGFDLTVLNPGSISRPRGYNKIPTFTVIDIDKDGDFHFNMLEYRS